MKLIYSILFSLIILSLFTSCRKGENDPLLSLRTRKARITGTWKLNAGFYRYNSPGKLELEVEYDGTNATERLGGNFKQAYNYEIEFQIRKDFTFERNTFENGQSKTEKGNWFFAGKSKELDLKNKEAIILSLTSTESSNQTTTFTGVRTDEIWVIDRLSNEELIFKGENTYTSTTTDTESYDLTYLKF